MNSNNHDNDKDSKKGVGSLRSAQYPAQWTQNVVRAFVIVIIGIDIVCFKLVLLLLLLVVIVVIVIVIVIICC